MLMRVTSKLPCVVINLAFLGGASGALRHRVIFFGVFFIYYVEKT